MIKIRQLKKLLIKTTKLEKWKMKIPWHDEINRRRRGWQSLRQSSLVGESGIGGCLKTEGSSPFRSSTKRWKRLTRGTAASCRRPPDVAGGVLSPADGVIAGGRGYVLESERREWWFVCLNYSELQGFCVLNQNSWLIFCFSLKMKLLVAQRLDYQLITDYKKNWNKNFKKTFILHSSTFVIQWWCHFYYIFIFHLIYMKRSLGLGPVDGLTQIKFP